MRKLLSFLIGIVIMLPGSACNVSQPVSLHKIYSATGFEVIIKLVDPGNVIDKVMEVFNRNGIGIARIQHAYFGNERQEFLVSVRCGNSKQLNGVEQELRSVLAIESISIRRI